MAKPPYRNMTLIVNRVAAQYETIQTRTLINQPEVEPVIYNSFSNVKLGHTEVFRPQPVWNPPSKEDGYRDPSPFYASSPRQPFLGKVKEGPSFTFRQNRNQSKKWWRDDVYTFRGEQIVEAKTLANNPHSPENLFKNKQDELRTKLLINAKDEILDVAMVLAEMRGAASVISNGLYRVGRGLDSLRLRRPENFRYLLTGQFGTDGRRPTDKFLRQTSDVFLEWKYGIMPTMYDIEGASKALDANEDGSLWDNPALMVARASLAGKSSFDVLLESGVRSKLHKVRTDWNCHARLDFSVEADLVRGLSRYGIGLGSVATVALERTPFLFVLNMGLPIIDLVKAWQGLAGVTQRGYSETYYCKQTVEKGEMPFAGNSDAPIVEWDDTPLHPVYIRKAYKTVPMPGLHLKNPINTGNLSTVLALFTSLRKPELIKQPRGPKTKLVHFNQH